MNWRLAFAALLLCAGCAHRPALDSADAEARWALRRAQLETLTHYSVNGRAAGGSLFAPRADFRWQQDADGRFELRLSGPFGLGAVTLSGDDLQMEVQTPQGGFQTSDPQGWIAQTLGWRLPLAQLRRWMIGLPATDAPEQLELDNQGRLALLVEAGWTLRYLDYAEAGIYELPRRIEASNGEGTIKLIADVWGDLP